MLVTVVIPTYQRAGFVETAIESVLRQEGVPVEVLAIDDGSTDGTDEVLARIAERTDPERFRWWRHENVGQAETINRGFAEARGDLLGYISSDDYLLPGAIERLVQAADQHPDVDVVYPWCDVIDREDRVVDTLELLEHTMVDAVRWNLCMVASGALVRRRYLERVGGWDPSFPHCADYEWWLRGGDARFLCVPERLAVWRTHPGSLTTTMGVRARLDDQLRMLDALFASPDLPEPVAAVRDEAYAALLIGSGQTMLEGQESPRFLVWDQVAGRVSRQARENEEHALAWHVKDRRRVEQRTRQLERLADQRDKTVGALVRVTEQQAARIADLETQLADQRAVLPRSSAEPVPEPPVRPLWLRLGRRITPRGLRHRVGVAVHRLGGAR